MRHKELKFVTEIPEGVEVKVDNNSLVSVKGKKGELKRELKNPKIIIRVEDKKVIVSAKNANKNDKTNIGTFDAHIRNMINGVIKGYNYKLKVCASHFPVTVAVKGNEIEVKNFLGEKIPRKVKFSEDVKIKVEGSVINVDGIDVEKVGQTAAKIEQLCRVTRKDRRVFQDGIFITEKDGKEIV